VTPSRHIRLAVDIGGTFTDAAIEVDGAYVTAKRLTSVRDPVDSVLHAVNAALARANLRPSQVDVVLQHGTTLATNAIIERRGAVVGLITTSGFRDVLEIAYERRYDQYDLGSHHPEPLVPRDRCYSVDERIGADGRVLVPLEEGSALAAIRSMQQDGVESIAIGLINSFTNPSHERQIAAIAQRSAPELPISLSSEVSPEMREYDRLTTTVANAYILPLIAKLLADFESVLRGAGFTCPILMMTSAGGMTSSKAALRFPVRLLESGPAGGAVLAARVAARAGLSRALSFDMGGTTAKICIIQDGKALRTRELEVGRASRATKHSGLPIRIPSVDLMEIGSGGGSLAHVERFRGLVVGPDSAGSDPGPACYGRGGRHATVTDADCVIGFLDPETFGDGSIVLDRSQARAAILRDLASGLGLDEEPCARAVRDVVDESMANAARVHAAERGVDLTHSVLIAFGGNGPLHAADVARKVGIKAVVIPSAPGVGSALGFLCAPISYETIRSNYALLDDLDADEVERMLTEMEAEARAVVDTGGHGLPVRISTTAFMRYRGQGHEIEVLLGDRRLSAMSKDELRAGYEAEYANLYGRVPPDMTIEIRNWAVAATTADRSLAVRSPGRARDATQLAEAAAKRTLCLAEETVDVSVYEREDLSVGSELRGPLIVAEAQTSTYVPEGAVLTVNSDLDLVIALGAPTNG
jgi:N-methylhydantoinase A